MKVKRFKTILIIGAVIAGIMWAVCAIWTIYDPVCGGPSRWCSLIPVTLSVFVCAFNLYQYFKDEKSKK